MAISGSGISFFPLYYIYHDCWKWYDPAIFNPPIHNHWGHMHFFMMGYKPQEGQQDAFSGSQTYKFEIKDIWGPRSGDPNQSTPYRVIGKPRWYFHITEVWRRIYLQTWDENVTLGDGQVVGRRGIRWDASHPNHTFGPFREGRNHCPIFVDGARTLPVEHFTTENRLQSERDNYIKSRFAALLPPEEFNEQDYIPSTESLIPKGPNGGRQTYGDNAFIWPTLEYQQVVQLNWERPPGWEAQHDIDSENFGDGWSTEITVPFTNPVTNKYRSPFGPEPGVVMPAGQYYNNLVAADRKMKNRARQFNPPQNEEDVGSGIDWVNRPVGMTTQQSEALTTFFDPYNVNDGMWVQQCLGGIVQAQAKVTIEHKAYGVDSREDRWVSSTQYLPNTPFAGSDQSQPT